MGENAQGREVALRTELDHARARMVEERESWSSRWNESQTECKRLRDRASQLEVQVEQLRKLNSDRIEAARKAERVKFETEKSKLREECVEQVRREFAEKLEQAQQAVAYSRETTIRAVQPLLDIAVTQTRKSSAKATMSEEAVALQREVNELRQQLKLAQAAGQQAGKENRLPAATTAPPLLSPTTLVAEDESFVVKPAVSTRVAEASVDAESCSNADQVPKAETTASLNKGEETMEAGGLSPFRVKAVEQAIGPKWLLVWKSAVRAGSLETVELLYRWASAKAVGHALLGVAIEDASEGRPKKTAKEVATERGHTQLVAWLEQCALC